MEQKKIYAASVDYDFCIANPTFLANDGRKQFIADQTANEGIQPLIDHIVKQKEIADEAILMVGTNRQSITPELDNFVKAQRDKDGKEVDLYMGSAYPVFEALAKATNTRLDKYVLSDSYCHLADGTTFQSILDSKLDDQYDQLSGASSSEKMRTLKSKVCNSDDYVSDYAFDDTKFTLLYAQMHRLAAQNPDTKITYDFYDDNNEILERLAKVFLNNPNLMPKNLTLNLKQYTGEPNKNNEYVSLKQSIQGVGEIDKNYDQSLVKFANLVKGQLSTQNKDLNYEQKRGYNFMVKEYPFKENPQADQLFMSRVKANDDSGAVFKYIVRGTDGNCYEGEITTTDLDTHISNITLRRPLKDLLEKDSPQDILPINVIRDKENLLTKVIRAKNPEHIKDILNSPPILISDPKERNWVLEKNHIQPAYIANDSPVMQEFNTWRERERAENIRQRINRLTQQFDHILIDSKQQFIKDKDAMKIRNCLVSLQTELQKEANSVREKDDINFKKLDNLEKIVASTEAFIETGIRPLIEFDPERKEKKDVKDVLNLATIIKSAGNDYKNANLSAGQKIFNGVVNLVNVIAHVACNGMLKLATGHTVKSILKAEVAPRLFRGYAVKNAAGDLAKSFTEAADNLNKSSSPSSRH